jgi:hypothetical protein
MTVKWYFWLIGFFAVKFYGIMPMTEFAVLRIVRTCLGFKFVFSGCQLDYSGCRFDVVRFFFGYPYLFSA